VNSSLKCLGCSH